MIPNCGTHVAIVVSLAVGSVAAVRSSSAALLQYDGGPAGTSSTWLAAANWAGDALPGTTTTAEFASPAPTLTSIGINLNTAGGAYQVGGIQQSGGTNRSISNSSTTVGGTVTLNGDAGVVLRNTSATNTLSLSNINSGFTLALPNASQIDVTQATGLITINNPISGAGRITKAGLGTLTLVNTASTKSGGIQVDGGTLSLTSTSAITTTSPAATYVSNQLGVANGASVVYTNTISAATVGFQAGIQLGAGGGRLSVSNAGTTLTWNGIVSGSGDLTKAGPGQLTLAPQNSVGTSISETYTGRLIITGGILSSFTTTGAGTPSTFTPDQLTLDGGTFRYTDAGSTINFGGNRGVTVAAGGGGINVSSSTETLIISTPIVSAVGTTGAFNVLGNGTLRSTNGNTYAGATTVGDGTSTGYYRVNGTHLGGASYIVMSNARLGGLGTISLTPGGAINVGGTLTPGGSIASTSAGLEYIESLDVIGNVNLFSGPVAGTLAVDVDTTAAMPTDVLNVSGVLDVTGSSLALNVVSSMFSNGTYTIANFSSLVGTFTNEAALNAAGYRVIYSPTSIQIAVPEPTSLTLLGLGAAAMLRRRRA